MIVVQILIAILILSSIIAYVASAYDSRQNVIKKHIENGDINLQATPDSMTKNELRSYTVNYVKDSQTQSITLKAKDRFDAKYKAMANYDVDLKSILSVV